MLKRFLTTLLLSLTVLGNAWSEATRPDDPSLVLAEVPSVASAKGPLAALSEVLRTRPNDLDTALTFARSAIELGRTAADPRFYGQAEAALKPWWNASDAPAEVRILRATIRQAYHQFDLAVADLEAVVADDPGNAQAHFSLAFIELTRGRPASAAASCDRLGDGRLKLVQAICKARVAGLTGKGEEAAIDLVQAVTAEKRNNLAMTRFAIAVLADIKIGTGDWAAATRYYQQTLTAGSADAATVAAYADVLLALNKPQDAIAALEGQGSADIIVLRQAIAAKRLGDPRLATWQAVLRDRFAANAASGNRVHLREEARFLLEVMDEVPSALALAVENFAVQKEPADSELLLRAAIAAKNPGAARVVLDHIGNTGLRDQRLDPLVAKLATLEGQS